jgi:hypothetical protein
MNTESITPIKRFNRIVFGAILIGITMASDSVPLGWLAVLPLLAILPILSGLTGIDPISPFVDRIYRRLQSKIISGTGSTPSVSPCVSKKT